MRSSLAASLTAYAAGILLAGTVTALGSYRLVHAITAELVPAETRVHRAASDAKPAHTAETPRPPRTPLMSSPAQSSAWPRTGIPRSRLAEPAFFGSSSRYWGRAGRRDRDDDDDSDDEDRPHQSGAYRTMCVRLCDGYYFPISFATTPDRFARDARACESSCGGEARLFVYRNPGADVEDMVDLQGRPYRQLGTAFRYRTEYVAACRCKPDPWQQEARDRHRLYALIAAKRKGSQQAAAEADALAAKLKQSTATAAKQPDVAPPAEPPAVAPTARTAPAPQPAPERSEDRTDRMALGARQPRESRERPSQEWRRNPDWATRAFGSAN